jgi:hypothetical protein
MSFSTVNTNPFLIGQIKIVNKFNQVLVASDTGNANNFKIMDDTFIVRQYEWNNASSTVVRFESVKYPGLFITNRGWQNALSRSTGWNVAFKLHKGYDNATFVTVPPQVPSGLVQAEKEYAKSFTKIVGRDYGAEVIAVLTTSSLDLPSQSTSILTLDKSV